MSSRNLEFSIRKKTLEDLLASHLYAISMVNDDEDMKITIKGDLNFDETQGEGIPLKVEIFKRQEVSVS